MILILLFASIVFCCSIVMVCPRRFAFPFGRVFGPRLWSALHQSRAGVHVCCFVEAAHIPRVTPAIVSRGRVQTTHTPRTEDPSATGPTATFAPPVPKRWFRSDCCLSQQKEVITATHQCNSRPHRAVHIHTTTQRITCLHRTHQPLSVHSELLRIHFDVVD